MVKNRLSASGEIQFKEQLLTAQLWSLVWDSKANKGPWNKMSCKQYSFLEIKTAQGKEQNSGIQRADSPS